jgi:hypothetical protein
MGRKSLEAHRKIEKRRAKEKDERWKNSKRGNGYSRGGENKGSRIGCWERDKEEETNGMTP